RAPLGIPDLGARDFLAIIQRQDVRQIGIGVRRGLVVVRVIGRRLIATRTGTQLLDAELLHHVLMVLGRRPSLRLGGGRGGQRATALRRGGRLLRQDGDERRDGEPCSDRWSQ